MFGLILGWGCVDYRIQDQDSAFESPSWVVETFRQDAPPELDLLWVVDGTGSMTEELAALGEASTELMQTLAGLDLSWQLGILAAELGTDRAGRLLEPAGVLTGDQEDAVGRLRASLPEAGSGAEPEAGIAAMLRGLSAPMLEGPNRGFLRPESTLHVVIFSDSDDHSEVWLDDPLQAALDWAAGLEQELVVSAVVGDPGQGCSSPDGVASPGDRYAELAEATGGQTYSICGGDWGEVLSNLGTKAARYPDTFVLQATPSQRPRVAVDGLRVEDWSLGEEPPRVIFDEAPAPGSEIEVRYLLEGS